MIVQAVINLSISRKGPEWLETVTLRHRHRHRHRHRDSGEQERLKISDLLGKLLPLEP